MERKNTWSVDDDKLLADVVLTYMKNGGTQTSAFQEVAAKLGRTIAACSFRWNSTLKKKYENSISRFNPKKNTKGKAISTVIVNEPSTQEVTNNNLIKELSEYINDVSDYINELEEKIEQQQKEIEKLREQTKINRDRLIASDDLQKIISIISSAKQKGYLGRAN